MTDNKTCSVDILSVSLGEEGYLIIPRDRKSTRLNSSHL